MTSGELVTKQDSATNTPAARRSWMDWAFVAVLAATALVALARLWVFVQGDRVVPPYKATLFFVNYDNGFVRRGLPGQMLSWLSGGQPSSFSVQVFGVALSLCGATSVAVLAWRLGSEADEASRLPIFTLLACSPFTLPLALRDLGRYDALVIAATIAISLLASSARATHRPIATCIGAAILLLGAAASEEFAVAFAAPAALLAAWRLARGCWRSAATYSLVILGPAGALGLVALKIRPSPTWVAYRVNEATAAGVVQPPNSIPGDDAASMLAASVSEQWAAFGRYSPETLIGTWIGIGTLAVIVSTTLWLLAGRPAPRVCALLGFWLLLATVGLSAVGVDYLRWWALATAGFASALLLLPRDRSQSTSGRAVPFALAVAVLCLLTQDVPIEPVRAAVGA